MLAVTLTVTQAGLDALVDAQAGNTAAIEVAEIGLAAAPFTVAPTLTGLPHEFKRIGAVSGDAVNATTIHMVAQDNSSDAYTAYGFGAFLADGTLFAVYAQATPLVTKVSVASFLIALDIAFNGTVAGSITFGDANFLLPPASETEKGVIELATLAEAQAGIDALRALTPASAKAAILGWLLAQDGSGSGLDADLLDGQHGSFYADIPARLGFTPLNAASYTAADVLTKLLGVDGAGSGLDADTLDGADSSAFVRFANWTGANQSLAATGFQYLPGGLILQWGAGTAPNNGTAAITFPVAFPNACLFGAVQGGLSDPAAQDNYPAIIDWNAASMTVSNGQNSLPMRWFALGF